MQKQAPSIGRILVAVGFALSCFALMLFLWITFGGPRPFAPESYRFNADFPEAITLQKEADVRIGGVSVGKVKELTLPPEGNATRAVIELEPQYAPLSSDARAILRQKTLLGESYIELTSGTQTNGSSDSSASNLTAQASSSDVGNIVGDDAPHPIEEGGDLPDTQIHDQVQIDEIFKALDEQTRNAFRVWMQNSAIAINGRGLDFNDALGNLGPFASDASDILETLREQEADLRTLVRSTGATFAALTDHDQELAGAIVGSNKTFGALASRDEALKQVFQIFPTFNMEARKTLLRLQKFGVNARPLFRDLKPVARDLSPTLRDLRRLSKPLRRLFRNLSTLLTVGEQGIPALRDIVRELLPVMKGLDPFLANFNPIVRYLDYQKLVATDFLGNPSAGTSGFIPKSRPNCVGGIPNEPNCESEPKHESRQMGMITPESLSVYGNRLSTNRGNAYLQPGALAGGTSPFTALFEIFPNHDCNNTGATGGLGGGQMNKAIPPGNPALPGGVPASTPAPQPGLFPLSIASPTILNNLIPGPGPFPDPFPGDVAARAPCFVAPPFPAQFSFNGIPNVVPSIQRDP